MSLNSAVFTAIRRSFIATTSSRTGFLLSNNFATTSDNINVDKKSLSKLRKQTGFAFSKCREALVISCNDYQEAEKWLQEQAQKEGWAKASKLKDRNAAEGLVGILVENNLASMIEVNCETDFVARNENFQSLVSTIARTAVEYRLSILQRNAAHSSSGGAIAHLREVVPTHILLELQPNHGKQETIAELIAREIGMIGEKIHLNRAITMTTEPSNTLGSFVHGSFTKQLDQCIMGKYGACVALRPTKDIPSEKVSDLAWRLSQHVIGMNPLYISSAQAEGGATKENILYDQAYLHDGNVTVGQFVKDQGVEVVDFVRYVCGQ